MINSETCGNSSGFFTKKLQRTGSEMLGDLIQRIPVAIYASSGLEEKGDYINPAFTRMFGYTLAEIPDLAHWLPLAYPDPVYREYVAQEWKRRVERAIETHSEIEPMESVVRCKDGTKKTISWHFVSTPVQNWSLGVDITDRARLDKELKASEEKFRLALELFPTPVAIANASGQVILYNQAFTKCYGYTIEDAPTIESWWPRAYPDPSYRAEVLARWAKYLEDVEKSPEDTNPLSVCVTCKDGSVRNLEIINRRIGEIFIGLFNDVTERIIAEGEIKLSKERYLSLFSEMQSGCALHEIICNERGEPVDYRFLAVNPAFERMTGLQASNVVGRTVLEVLPGIEKSWIEKYGRVALTGESIQFEDFSQELGRNYEVNAYRSAPNQFACVINDITQRQESAEQLKQANRFLDSIIENIPANFFLKEAKTLRYVRVNRMQSDVIGWSRSDVIGRTVYDIFPKDQADFFTAMDRKALASNSVVDIQEEPLNTKSGDVRILHTRKVPLLNDKGELEYLLGISEDVTERKKADEEREKLREQLLHSQKMESVGRLAGGVAHDFNNMLGVILGQSEMALKKLSPDNPLYDSLKEIRETAERSAGLTRQLLAFARKQPIMPKTLDLNVMVDEMTRMIQRLIGENISLDWLPGEGLWAIRADPSQIDQILVNLCVNARDAITGLGKITIQTANFTCDDVCRVAHPENCAGDYVMLSVTDTGCGMDQETLAHLFEPFFTTKGLGQGTGLGLATVYGIVKQNNGLTEVISSPSSGTTFRIFLPRHAPVASEQAFVRPVQADVRGSEAILLVEDEVVLSRVTAAMLQSFGYRVFVATTPAEALDLAQKHGQEIQILITDVVMPEMNGKELSARLRSIQPSLKCLFTSGYTANVMAEEGLIVEGIHFLQKPYSIKSLASKVREALGK